MTARPGTFFNLEAANRARSALHQVDPSLDVRVERREFAPWDPDGDSPDELEVDYSVYASLPDLEHGGFVTRRILSVPSRTEAQTIVDEMRFELERRAQDVRHRRALERDRNHE